MEGEDVKDGHRHNGLDRHLSTASQGETKETIRRQPSVEIDDLLYSRQRYVLGDEAMKRMHTASVLILGLGGLGVEIAKNLILGGVKKVSLWDNQPAKWSDLSGNFYITEEDVKKRVSRVDACIAKLRELNPGVTVEIFEGDATSPEGLRSLHAQFNCVIATEIALASRIALNRQLRSHKIPFIMGDAFGIFVTGFCDFGDEFLVQDPRPEEGRELLISHITQAEKGEVTCLEGYLHHLEDGDLVEFKDVRGMTELNGRIFVVDKVVSPLSFSIGDTSKFSPHEQGGIAKQAPKPKTVTFKSLEESVHKPALLDCDLARFNAAKECHVSWIALMQFEEKHSRLPNHQDHAEINEAVEIAKAVAKDQELTDFDEKFVEAAIRASSGQLNPLVATMGGVLAQEAMKALTGKWTPLNQWLHLDARDVYSQDSTVSVRDDRYDGIRVCIGDKAVEQLKSLKIFMVGCGAIGCETLKNLALIGAGCGSKGMVTITDDDRIEKSNLNRQFLFRPEHIGKSKSEMAADRVKCINPDMKVSPHLLRVSPATQKTPFNDEFYHNQDVVVNALDNVQARMYMDSRCVTNCKPLLDSGTLSTKGHVQVVVPFLTESYGTQRDPAENAGDSIPYCTLKSFPALIEHCIEWAREKFQSSFSMKPEVFNTFWNLHGPSTGQVLQALQKKSHLENVATVYKLIGAQPKSLQDVVEMARMKFEKYFTFKALQLLYMFPEDHVLEGGIRFWTAPKRAPIPVVFDPQNKLHMDFIRSATALYAHVYNVPVTTSDLTLEKLKACVANVHIPNFVPKGKEVASVTATTAPTTTQSLSHSAEEAHRLADLLQSSLQRGDFSANDTISMHPESFEKDDDTNFHIDFIYAAANLRAAMYRIDMSSRTHVKRIAGRIVPAIATTTACVSGLATLELIKLAQDLSKMTPETKHLLDNSVLSRYKNTFLNLALPVIYFSEPGEAKKTVLPGGITVSLWDQWSVNGDMDFTMQNFVDAVKDKYHRDVSTILQGSKMVYMPFMPGHKNRLVDPFKKYLDLPEEEDYIDLSVDMGDDDETMDGEENLVIWPPVRYFFRSAQKRDRDHIVDSREEEKDDY